MAIKIPDNMEPDIVNTLVSVMSKTDFIVLVNSFDENTSQRMSDVINSVKSNNLNALRAAAHSLKGVSANVGAKNLSHIAYGLEKLAKESLSHACVDEKILHEFENNFMQEKTLVMQFLYGCIDENYI